MKSEKNLSNDELSRIVGGGVSVTVITKPKKPWWHFW